MIKPEEKSEILKIAEEMLDKEELPRKFFSLLQDLSESKKCILDIFYEALKILVCRKERKLHKNTHNKILIKSGDVTRCLNLINYFYCNYNESEFKVDGQLAGNFGKLNENEAIRYYDQFVKGEYVDSYCNKVLIDNEAKRSLYKDKETGKHEIEKENYLEIRGKRLPWIKHTIQNTKLIYEQTENDWTTILYVGIFLIPLKEVIEFQEVTTYSKNYFLVIGRKEYVAAGKKVIRIRNAYPIEKKLQLFRHLEPSRPMKNI